MSTVPAQPPKLGKYLLLRKLGGGGMGRVYLASVSGPAAFEKKVVVKTILPTLTQNKDYVQLFLNEARLGARLSHSAIAGIFELAEENGLYYLVMEYVDGWTLRQAIKGAQKMNRLLNPARVAEVVARACEGLYYAHTLTDRNGRPLGIVHRDLSPQNIMISREGDVKIIDFGVARSDLSTNETVAGTIKGKICYMSPEQSRGERVDARSDIFALGIVLYEALTGNNPFERDTPLSILRAIDSHDPPSLRRVASDLGPFDPIVRRCLQKEKDKRYPDARELRMDLLAVLERQRAKERDHLGTWVSGLLDKKSSRVLVEGAEGGEAPPPEGEQGAESPEKTVLASFNPFEGPKDPGLALPDEPAEPPGEAAAEQATRLKTAGEMGLLESLPPPRSRAAEPPPEPDSPPEEGEAISHVSGLRRGPSKLLIAVAAVTGAVIAAAVFVKLTQKKGPAPEPSPAKELAAAVAAAAKPAAPPPAPTAAPTAAAVPAAQAATGPAAVPAPSGPAVAGAAAPAPIPSAPVAEAANPAEAVPPEPAKAEEPPPEPAAAGARPHGHRRSSAHEPREEAAPAPPVVVAQAPAPASFRIRAIGATHVADAYGNPVNPNRAWSGSANLQVGSLLVQLKESAGSGRTLYVASQPWTIASVNGVSRGKTPLPSIALPDRGVRLELVRPGMDAPAVLQISPSAP